MTTLAYVRYDNTGQQTSCLLQSDQVGTVQAVIEK